MTTFAIQHPTLSPEEILDRELGRFFQAADIYQGVTGELAMMPVCIVDVRWHDLLGTDIYTQIIQDCLGEGVTIEHLESGGRDVMGWMPYYHKLFGKLDDVWFTLPDGTLNNKCKRAYESGNWPEMSWDCTPGFVREDEADTTA
jgi:hypothetical protein